MKVVTQKSNAKINIGLNVLGKREDGYHNLEMIMVPITLSDIIEVTFFSKKGDLSITCNKKDIPTGRDNIIYKIYEKFYKITGIENQKMHIKLTKKIPSEAGLGGGSSNGGCFLKILNKYHNNILSEKSMIKLSKTIGADIPFFIKNKTSIVRGIGEKIEIIPNNLLSSIILIKPKFGISAKEGYKSFSMKKNYKKANLELIKKGLENNNLGLVKKNIQNNLQEALLKSNNKLYEFQRRLEKLDYLDECNFFMTGSGTTYYTFVKDEKIDEIYIKLKRELKNINIIKSKIKSTKGKV
ncbi:MAG: 4-(cytidine 5'-diphospho)-2-C-methyl-D-erythritol kinase [Fusobacteriota bacterium]